MGYRSEVALCLNTKAHKHWQTLLEKAKQENKFIRIGEDNDDTELHGCL